VTGFCSSIKRVIGYCYNEDGESVIKSNEIIVEK